MQAVISPHIKYTNMASLQSTGEEKMFVDISQAMERIQLTQTVSSLTDTACCNPDKWQKPITEFGQCDPELLGTILRSDFVGDIDCGSADWTDSCQVVDAVMDLILKQLQELAGKYEGLCIKEYIRQGSAREGLKIWKDFLAVEVVITSSRREITSAWMLVSGARLVIVGSGTTFMYPWYS
ncbi:uncharacterized protein LOC127844338 isoform X4 [Dreissena polymorpha]|uniref:uncharacterized protein LOC127844338 isoform X4 n=1 Tax=Dreissena polymorpha TaxID=45954 RepID=UPI002264CF04|nr:uncharacterized protein LOC127844338 isoform X4 [Dreissena polymorpha]